MPLPALLLERLKRRKIIQVQDDGANEPEQAESSDKNRPPQIRNGQISGSEQELEEIIVEHYSDDEDDCAETGQHQEEPRETGPDGNKEITDQDESKNGNLSAENQDEIIESVLGCPNKYNIYHSCSQYCVENYSHPEETSPTMDQRKQLALILRTYPMSNEWTVVYDPGVKTFYFWNIMTNLVSWLPPGMNGFISLPADQIRKSLREMETSNQLEL